MDMPPPISVPGNETIMDQSELIDAAGPASWGVLQPLGGSGPGGYRTNAGQWCQEGRGHRAHRGLGCLETCRETAWKLTFMDTSHLP